MHRVTITLDDALMAALERRMAAQDQPNRSEAVRDLVRAALAEEPAPQGDCAAALVYVYDHETRHLAQKLTGAQHDRHDLSVATLHVHLDHESCLEVAVLRGPQADVERFAGRVTGERGVRYGRLVTIPVAIEPATHGHGDAVHAHPHVRVRTRG